MMNSEVKHMSIQYNATLHIHPRGQRAIQVATARVAFLNGTMQLYDVQTPDGTTFEGPLEPDDLGRMLDFAYLVLLEDGRKYRVAPIEMTDRWYVSGVK
jgi:hypothetical protein